MVRFHVGYFKGFNNEKCDELTPAGLTCCRILRGKSSSLKGVRKNNLRPSRVFDATCEDWFIIQRRLSKTLLLFVGRSFFQIYVFVFSPASYSENKPSVERLFSKIFVLVLGRSFFKFTDTTHVIYSCIFYFYHYMYTYGWHSEFLV